MRKIDFKFEKIISAPLKSTLMCVAIICASIMLSSCQKDSAGDPAPPPVPPTPPTTEGRAQLPVIFHVMYKNAAVATQYVSAGRLTKIIDNVNKMYRSTAGSVDMNIEFVLAQTDPLGKTLSTPGVEYINWTQKYPGEAYPIDCDIVMEDETRKYVPLLWDPNKYINVLLYNFSSDDSGYTTLGIANLPYVNSAKNTVDGLMETNATYLTLANFGFAYCVSINSLFVEERYESTPNSYSGSDINVTLAHELGHYLGLHHAFASDESTGKMLNNDKDTDYCLDTPSYDRITYQRDYIYAQNNPIDGNWNFTYLVKRKNTKGTFDSHNIMDYEVCYADQFSADQRTRVRYVLDNALAMPRAAKSAERSRALEGVIDLPIMTMR